MATRDVLELYRLPDIVELLTTLPAATGSETSARASNSVSVSSIGKLLELHKQAAVDGAIRQLAAQLDMRKLLLGSPLFFILGYSVTQ